MNRRTSRSTSGEGQEVGRKGDKPIGKKIINVKKPTLYKKKNKSKLQ